MKFSIKGIIILSAVISLSTHTYAIVTSSAASAAASSAAISASATNTAVMIAISDNEPIVEKRNEETLKKNLVTSSLIWRGSNNRNFCADQMSFTKLAVRVPCRK